MYSSFRSVLLPFALVLSGCMPSAPIDTATRAAPVHGNPLTEMKVFSSPNPVAPLGSNSDIARDFLDLAFSLESGRRLPVLTRFETPVSVRVTGNPAKFFRHDLKGVIKRLRNEAGIDIFLTDADAANITIESVSHKDIQKNLPSAACFVVPNISSLADYRAAQRNRQLDWAKLESRNKLAIFIPNDVPPQEVRDCLHEELAQALGPLNDLYRLPDSVFNDDNIHTVLTGYDMMILRAYYAPELRSGMTRSQVAAILPSVLARINPRGQGIAPRRSKSTPPSWKKAIRTALGRGVQKAKRKRAASEALQIARTLGWNDHRMAFSHYAMGRILQSQSSQLAEEHFVAANHYYSMVGSTQLHRSYVSSQLAAYALAKGNATKALKIATAAIPPARRNENAALLATLEMLQAKALEMQGRQVEADAVRLDSLGWARYGFGSDRAVRAKIREVASLYPANGPS